LAKKPAFKPERTIGRDELAEILGVHPETIGRYDREGAPHTVRNRRNCYNEAEYKAWCDVNGKTLVQGRPIEGDSPDLEKARLRKENALAAKYEIQVARERGLLVPVDEVRAMGAVPSPPPATD
jgi:phage terminase Nu1 subunit (DNA packaging protein)